MPPRVINWEKFFIILKFFSPFLNLFATKLN
nr:MAG TPA: hypothetical protein [Ackermannviridae sp.]